MLVLVIIFHPTISFRSNTGHGALSRRGALELAQPREILAQLLTPTHVACECIECIEI